MISLVHCISVVWQVENCHCAVFTHVVNVECIPNSRGHNIFCSLWLYGQRNMVCNESQSSKWHEQLTSSMGRHLGNPNTRGCNLVRPQGLRGILKTANLAQLQKKIYSIYSKINMDHPKQTWLDPKINKDHPIINEPSKNKNRPPEKIDNYNLYITIK